MHQLFKTRVQLNYSNYDCPREVFDRLLRLKVAVKYSGTLSNFSFDITFASETEENCDDHLRVILKILKGLLPFSKCKKRSLTATILFSDHKKIFPAQGVALDRVHVNTGYARRCREIVIYRREEWRKVFIHECMHFFKLDRALAASRQTLFHVRVRVDLCETFCEVWARAINCTFSSSFEVALKKEQRWACTQLVKVLKFMNLTYEDLLNGTNLDLYQENTNVFAYIILSAILMHDIRKFFEWSQTLSAPNGNIMQVIETIYKSPSFLEAVAAAEHEAFSPSLRMSIT